jgi:hypothetical protein
MPSATRVRLATPLSRAIMGFVATPNQRTGAAATFAVARGSETARVLGTISPTIIENTVAMSIARTEAVDAAAAADSPRSSSGPRSRAPMEGLAMKPRTRVVSVMPSWHAESCVESLRWEASTDLAPGSPASTARCTVGRSSATSENSAATNNAVPTVSTTPRSSRSHSVMGRPVQEGAWLVQRTARAPAPGTGCARRAPGTAKPAPAGSTPRGSRIHRGVDPDAG